MTDTKGAVLHIEDIHKRYGDSEVLKGISFSVKKGEVKVIIGSSGAGKSTLLRCINRLTVPDRGKVWLDDEEITNSNVTRCRYKMGMVFQDFNLFDHLTALKNVEIGLIRVKRLPKRQARERAVEELRRVGLEDKLSSYPAELSGGQKQRVSIARALAMDPEIMLFDEPTSALDPELIGEVLNVMKKLADRGITMVIVTHELGFARSVAHDIIFLDQGEILESGSPEKLFNNPENERARRFFSRISELY